MEIFTDYISIIGNQFIDPKKRVFVAYIAISILIALAWFIFLRKYSLLGALKKIFNKKIVTLVWKFEKFYKAESFHQDYYEKNFVRYLLYKKGCQREETLSEIWN